MRSGRFKSPNEEREWVLRWTELRPGFDDEGIVYGVAKFRRWCLNIAIGLREGGFLE